MQELLVIFEAFILELLLWIRFCWLLRITIKKFNNIVSYFLKCFNDIQCTFLFLDLFFPFLFHSEQIFTHFDFCLFFSSILFRFIKPGMSIFDEWLNAFCWSFRLFGIFIMKKCVELNLIFFGTAKYDWVIKTRDMFSFLPLINNLVTAELSFSLLIILAIISSSTINILCFLFVLYSSILL